MSKLTQEQIDNLMDACLSDSTKIIRYLEEEKRKQSKHNKILFICTIFGTTASIIAAITGLILLFG